jgi:hypothetical protein
VGASRPKPIEKWNRIVRSYKNGYSIPQLARRFAPTNAGIRYVLMTQKVLRKRNVMTNAGL